MTKKYIYIYICSVKLELATAESVRKKSKNLVCREMSVPLTGTERTSGLEDRRADEYYCVYFHLLINTGVLSLLHFLLLWRVRLLRASQ